MPSFACFDDDYADDPREVHAIDARRAASSYVELLEISDYVDPPGPVFVRVWPWGEHLTGEETPISGGDPSKWAPHRTFNVTLHAEITYSAEEVKP